MSKKQLDEAWKALPESDQRCIGALMILVDVIGDDKLRYHEPSPASQRSLRRLDRNGLFSLIAECLHLLLDSPLLDRVKQGHRRREAEKKKRTTAGKHSSAGKRRAAAPTSKRRTKKSAPHRRTGAARSI